MSDSPVRIKGYEEGQLDEVMVPFSEYSIKVVNRSSKVDLSTHWLRINDSQMERIRKILIDG